MVWKKFSQYLINKYLKNYIEQLDDEKLNFSLRNGNLLLENLRIKPDALAYLNIPATVVAGYIEQLKVTIPWKSLGKNPTEVSIDGLYMLIASKNEVNRNLNEHYLDKRRRVEEKVDKLRKTAFEKGKYNNNELDFLERMRLQIKQNLRFKIQNLHICYERKASNKLGHPFSFGITLHYLELTSTTTTKFSQRIQGNTLLIYKINEINSFSLYWNTNDKSRLQMSFQDILVLELNSCAIRKYLSNLFQNNLKSQIGTNDPNLNYIIRPRNLLTEFYILLKPKEHYYERSRFLFDIQIEEMKFDLTAKQISDILDFIKFQKYTTIYDYCREYRKLLSDYSFGTIKLTSEQEERLQYLEAKLDVFHLAYIRHKIEMEMYFSSLVIEHQQEPEVEIERNSNRRHHWNSLTKVKNKLNRFSKAVDQMKNRMFIQNEEAFIFEDLPKFDIQFRLNQIDFNLLSTNSFEMNVDNEILTRIHIKNTQLNFQRMSVSSQLRCAIDLNSIEIFGMEFNKKSLPPPILQMSSSLFPHIHMQFELFSANQIADYSFEMIIQPFRIFYDAPTINRIVECFQFNENIHWKNSQLSKLRKVFDIKIDLKGFSFILPEYGIYQKDFSIISLDFHRLLFKSDFSQNNFEFKEFYRNYQLELINLQFSYVESNKKKIKLFERISKLDINFAKSIYSNEETHPKWLININLPIKNIYLSKDLLTKLINHFQSIRLFYRNCNEILQRINFYFHIISPHTTLKLDLTIPNCCLQLQQFIQADFHMSLLRKITKNSFNSHIEMIFKKILMLSQLADSNNEESSKIFYKIEQLELNYLNFLEK